MSRPRNAAVLCFLLATTVGAVEAPKPSVQPVVLEPVEYVQLADKIGRHIVIETNLGTHRRGVLEHYSGSALAVRLEPKDGGFLLDLPRETVKQVELVVEDTVAGEGHAEKN